MDYNLLTDILLGLGIVLMVGALYEITTYITFNWCWILVGILVGLPIGIIYKIASLIKGESATVEDNAKYNSNAVSIDKQILTGVWYFSILLLFWLTPIAIELGIASLSVFIKYKLFGNLAMDDVYRICEVVPICLILIPCLVPKLKEMLPKYTKFYIYDDLSNILGVGSNILILLYGGWISYALVNDRILF
jgi:hypothetical protein